MPKLSFSVPHTLTRDEAAKRLRDFLPRVREHYQGQVNNVEEDWQGDTLNYKFSTFGFNIKGQMAVADDQVQIDQDLPLAAMMMKGKIEGAIREQLVKLLA